MEITSGKIWEIKGATGILSLPGGRGGYLYEPEFLPIEQVQDFFSEPGLKGIIVRGSGRHFSAGANLDRLKELAKDEALLYKKMTAGKDLINLIESTPLPVVAEISGACFGGGLEIALACHIRICSENALFAFPEVNHRLLPGLGGTIMLPKLIGMGRATEMILKGDVISSDKALEIKLVDYRVSAASLHEFTLQYIEKLTYDRDIAVIRSVMQSIRNGQVMGFDEAMEAETRLFCTLAVRIMKD